MDYNSMVRSVFRYWELSRLRQQSRLRRPQLEALEAREVLAATILSVSPLDGTVLGSNSTSITVTYSNNVIGADNPNNYILRDSSGQRIALTGVTYSPITFQATFSVADINNGAPLPLETYTLFVRGDQILDAVDLTPLAQPSRIVASNSLLRDVNVVDVNGNGSLASPGNIPIAGQGNREAQPYALASGDLNGDGLDDLVVVNGGNDTLNIFYGRSGSQGVGFATTPDLTLLLPIGALNPIKDVQIADFNNDGKNDIVVMNNFFDSITVFTNISENTGSAAFSAPNTFSGIIDPRELAVADFDGDGFKDIAVVNALPFLGSYDVTIFQNDQNTIVNNFLPFNDFSVGNLFSGVQVPVSLAVGDFNNDGKPDLVVAGNGLRILFNNSTPGNLAFDAGPVLSNSSFTSVAALRVDGNNSVDIVAVRDDGNLVTFLNLSTPTPSFVQRATTTGTVSTAGRLKVGDLNGDGRDELVVTGGASADTASVISTTTRFGAANFLTLSGVVQVQSFNHGLVTGDRVVISGVSGQAGLNGAFTITRINDDVFSLNSYIGDGTAATPGVWALTRTISGASNTPGGPIVITSNNHRLTDGTRVTVSAVGGNTAANGTWTVRVLSTNTFELVGSVPNGNYTSGGSWVVAGPLGVTATATTQDGPIGLTLLDVNQDGNLDVATANTESNSVTLLPGDGQRGFLTPDEKNLTQANTTAVAYADLNNDGILDIVAISTNAANAASRVSVMLGNADGSFQDAVDYAPATGTTFSRLSNVIVADVTGDGRPDIVVTGRATAGNDGVAILRNNITTLTLLPSSFLLGSVIRTGDAPTDVVAADFNGDGIVDLAVSHNLPGGVANSTRRGVTYLQGTGAGNFAPGVQVAAAQGFAAVGLVAFDYNGDGKLDLAVVDNSTPGQVLLLRGLGNGQFRSAGLFETGLSTPTDLVAGDVNNDGLPDLIVSSGSTGQTTGGVSVLLNDNATTLRNGIRSAVQPGVALNNLAVGDLNSDGLLDVVVGARITGDDSINNVFALYGKGDGTFTAATGYLTGEFPTGTSNTFVALGETPMLRLTTFKTGGTEVITNLVTNPGFEQAALGGQQGNLTGWQTFKLLTGPTGGSAGGYGPQT
ncbi:MAG: FG-GAP-like repeat-containing protein, partial [Gemmataceae bacterium]